MEPLYSIVMSTDRLGLSAAYLHLVAIRPEQGSEAVVLECTQPSSHIQNAGLEMKTSKICQ